MREVSCAQVKIAGIFSDANKFAVRMTFVVGATGLWVWDAGSWGDRRVRVWVTSRRSTLVWRACAARLVHASASGYTNAALYIATNLVQARSASALL